MAKIAEPRGGPAPPPPSPGPTYGSDDYLSMAVDFTKASYPNGLRFYQEAWWGAGSTAIWSQIPETELHAAVYRFLSLCRWRRGRKLVAVPTTRTSVLNLVGALIAVARLDPPSGDSGVALTDGIYEPVSAALRPIVVDDFVTWVLPFTSAQLAEPAPRWFTFLSEGSTPEDIALLQEWFGYCLLPSNKLQKTFWMYGEPGCGKSTIAKILCALVGERRVSIRKEESFRSSYNDDLLGQRLVYCPDYRNGFKEAKSALDFVLTVGGDDPMRIEGKYKKPFSTRIPLKILFTSNEMPMFRDTTSATLRRLLLWHRKKTFTARDPFLEDALLRELPGIFAWAVAGARRLLTRGDFDPAQIDAKLLRYTARATNSTYAFLSDAATFGADLSITKLALFEAWKGYALERGEYQRFNYESFVVSALQTARQFDGVKVSADDTVFYGLTLNGEYNPFNSRGPRFEEHE